MQAWALIRWWYGPGWKEEWQLQARHLARVEGFFSFGTLLRTLFRPFRQIDAGTRQGGLEVQFRAWLDRAMSRFVGASARLVLLVAGGVYWVLFACTSVLWLLLWPLLPVAPLVGVLLSVLGVGAV